MKFSFYYLKLEKRPDLHFAKLPGILHGMGNFQYFEIPQKYLKIKGINKKKKINFILSFNILHQESLTNIPAFPKLINKNRETKNSLPVNLFVNYTLLKFL